MQKEKILITGGAGYIGSVLTAFLLEHNYEVTVLDNLLYNQTSLLHLYNYKNFKFIKKDVTDFNFMKKEISNYNIIIPLAAIVGAPACNKKLQLSKLTNLDAIEFLANNITNEQKIIFPMYYETHAVL